jgi:hypothetical protein
MPIIFWLSSRRRQDKSTSQRNILLFNQLLTNFRDQLYELMGTSWCACVHQGFDQHRVERALVSSALTEIFDLAVESLGPEECARLISAIVNERLRSHQPIKR